MIRQGTAVTTASMVTDIIRTSKHMNEYVTRTISTTTTATVSDPFECVYQSTLS